MTRQNNNYSPGPGPGRLVPSSHQRSELSNSILGANSPGDKRVQKCITIPNGLGEKATLINVSTCISNGDLRCRRMVILTVSYHGDKIICWYTVFTLQTFIQQYESAVFPPFLEGYPLQMFKNASHARRFMIVVSC